MAVALRRKIEAKTMRVLIFGWLPQSRLTVMIIFDTQRSEKASDFRLGQRPGNHRLRGGGVGFLQLLLQIDGDFFDLTTEFEWDLVREIHWCASVFADVECFVERDADWHRSLDASLSDFFTINV
jgi:hypothetical protein